MTSGILAVDGGQTGIKVRFEQDGEPAELAFPGVQTHQPVLPQLARAIDQAITVAGQDCGTVSVGTTGLVKAEHDAQRLFELIGSTAIRHVALAHDSVTSYLGALGSSHGAVVAAGTGAVTLGVGPGAVARVDGWGNIMGDAGSGYWIGQQALDAAMRDFDGRGPATALTDAARDSWPELSEAYIALQARPDRISKVASFASTVASLAAADAVAAGICHRAGSELARSAASALRRTGLDQSAEPVPVAAIGGVFAGEQVRAAFEEQLLQQVPAARVQSTSGNGLDGAELLAGLPAEHALQQLVSHHRS